MKVMESYEFVIGLTNATIVTIVYPIVTIVALILGPFLAAWWLSWRDKKSAAKSQKIAVFQTLMIFRTEGISPSDRRVEAINILPIVFHDVTKVREDWKQYIHHLYSNGPYLEPLSDHAYEQRGHLLYQNILQGISKHLKYKFSDMDLLHGYTRQSNARLLYNEQVIREGLVNLLRDGKPLPIAVKEFPQPGLHPPAFPPLGSLSQRLK